MYQPGALISGRGVLRPLGGPPDRALYLFCDIHRYMRENQATKHHERRKGVYHALGCHGEETSLPHLHSRSQE